MPISILQWCIEIGIFNARFYIICKSNALWSLTPLLYTIARISIIFQLVFLILCGDIELNPGLNKKTNSRFNFSIFHWNLTSLTAHSFEKVNHLEDCNTANDFNIIYQSISFLDSWILTENNNLEIDGYTIMRLIIPVV